MSLFISRVLVFVYSVGSGVGVVRFFLRLCSLVVDRVGEFGVYTEFFCVFSLVLYVQARCRGGRFREVRSGCGVVEFRWFVFYFSTWCISRFSCRSREYVSFFQGLCNIGWLGFQSIWWTVEKQRVVFVLALFVVIFTFGFLVSFFQIVIIDGRVNQTEVTFSFFYCREGVEREFRFLWNFKGK